MLQIHSIETFGTHEGPGIRVVFFLQGCMMKCLYCHNPDTIPLKGGISKNNEEIISVVEKSKGYFQGKGGVTFSGGEPLLQAKALIPLCQELKKRGFHITIDTNGFLLNDEVKTLLQTIDLVLLDIKHLDKEEHIKLTGVSNEPVLNFAQYLEEHKKTFWIRHVLVPNYTDENDHLGNLGNFFQGYKYLERLEILPYHTLGVHKWKELGMKYQLDGVSAPNNEQILKAKNILENKLSNVLIRR